MTQTIIVGLVSVVIFVAIIAAKPGKSIWE
jgi:hypothetical protein